MKKILITAAFSFAIITMLSAQNTFQRIPDDNVSQTELRQATSLAEKLLLGQKSGNYYMLSEYEAIPQLVSGLTKEVQASSYESIQSMFGDYRSMAFTEAWTMEADQPYTVYRFKGTFNGTDEHPEIRMVFNKEGKLAGFWIRPWQDDLGGKP